MAVAIFKYIGAIILALALFACQTPPNNALVLRGARIVDVDAGQLTSPTDVLIQDGQIRRIEPSLSSVPDAALEIDADGLFLMPGFIEMHAHVLQHPWLPDGEISRQYDREWSLQILRTLLSYGITTVRDPGSPTEAALFLRQQLREKKIEGPTLYTAGRILIAYPFPYEPFTEVQTADDVRREIRWQAQAGVDFIKVYSSFTPDLIEVAVEEAHAHNLKVVGHLGRTSWTDAAPIGIDGFEHPSDWNRSHLPKSAPPARWQGITARIDWLESVDPEGPEIADMADAIARSGAFVDPTLITIHTKFFGDQAIYRTPEERKLVPEEIWSGWENGSFTKDWAPEQYEAAQAAYPKLPRIIRTLFERNVMLVVGTDTPTPWTIPGVSFHQEMKLLSESGVSNAEVLRMATINGARALGIDNSVGRLEPGYKADILILAANPLEDLANASLIEKVIVHGRIMDPGKLLQQP